MRSNEVWNRRRTDREPVDPANPSRGYREVLSWNHVGRTLEPDVRLPASSVLACTIALQVLARYRFNQPSDVLDGVSRFLVSAYDDTTVGGGIFGALLAGTILKRLAALRIFRLGGWIYFLSLALAAISPTPWQIGVAAAVFTFASAPMVTVWESYTVRRVPDRLTGRVVSASAFCAQSLTWIGMLVAGLLSDAWGASAAALCFAAILVPFAVAGHLAKSLALLRVPLERIEEVSDGPAR